MPQIKDQDISIWGSVAIYLILFVCFVGICFGYVLMRKAKNQKNDSLDDPEIDGQIGSDLSINEGFDDVVDMSSDSVQFTGEEMINPFLVSKDSFEKK